MVLTLYRRDHVRPGAPLHDTCGSKRGFTRVQGEPTQAVQLTAVALGLLALPMVAWSEYTLKTTGAPQHANSKCNMKTWSSTPIGRPSSLSRPFDRRKSVYHRALAPAVWTPMSAQVLSWSQCIPMT